MSWIAGTIEDVKDIANWFVMDIGFSNSSKSCGVVTVHNHGKPAEDEIYYGEIIGKFQDFIKKVKEGEGIGLIIEAPLSIAFNNTPGKVKDKNPVGRKGIEKDNVSTRYWYVGAGAAVALATVHFLHTIKNELTTEKIYLFEGLISFKNDTTKKSSHQRDALALYGATQKLLERKVEEQKDTTMMFIGDYLDISLENNIPPVIKVSDINGKDPQYSFHTFQSV